MNRRDFIKKSAVADCSSLRAIWYKTNLLQLWQFVVVVVQLPPSRP